MTATTLAPVTPLQRERVHGGYVRGSRTRPRLALLAVALLLASAGLALVWAVLGSRRASGVPIPSLVYDIETFSGSQHLHHAAVIGVPTPVDVDGDLLPDVDVSLGVVNLQGITNPADLSQIVRATLTVTRDPIANLLARPMPPLKLLVAITLVDSSTLQPANRIALGYDTGAGGSIPEHFEATLGGFRSGFNPLTATVDTIGGISGLTTDPLTKPAGYIGPLSIVGQIGLPGSQTTNLNVHYQPFPGQIGLTYGTDSSGSHIHYSQLPTAASHLFANLITAGPGSPTTTFTGDVDPMPPDLQVDFQSNGTDGNVNFAQQSSGRHPDAGFTLLSQPATGAPLSVVGSVSSLPSSIHAQWSVDPTHPAGSFDASGAGVGGLDLLVHNFTGASSGLTPFVAERQQYVNYQSVGAQTEVSAHLEYIRHLDFNRTADGFTAHASVGDGEAPLQVHYLKDDRTASTGSRISAIATLSPLPRTAAVTLHTSSAASPLELVTDLSQTADLDGHVELDPPGATTGCGTAKSLCGDVSVRHLPAHLDLRAGNIDSSGQGVDIDLTPTAGGIPPDVTADVTIGAGALALPANATTPLIGHVALTAIPSHLRARLHTDAAGQVDRVDFHACDWQFAATPPACAGGASAAAIAQVAFSLRNFTSTARPANIAPPLPTTAQYASVVARQASGSQPVLFEAAGSVFAVSDLELRNASGILGVRTALGGGKDLSAHVDIDNPTSTLVADATISPLPGQLDVCFRGAGAPAGASTGAPFTVACENPNPFNENPAPPASPISIAFDAHGATVAADAHVLFVAKGATPADNHTDQASVHTAALPSSLTATVRVAQACSAKPNCAPTRAIYAIPSGAAPTTVDITAQDSAGDSICQDPRSNATSRCLTATLENLPTTASICYDAENVAACDPAVPANNVVVTTTGGSAPFNIRNLSLSSVGTDATTHTLQVLVATGQILALPARVTAALGSHSFAVNASPPIGEVDAVVRNYIAPDPMNFSVPAQRAGLPTPHSQFAAFGRGDLFKITANVKTVSGIGYQVSVAPDGSLLKTQQITVGFDPGQVVRGYADIVSATDGSQTIGDVTLVNNPAGIALCFRGPDAAAPTATNAVWCDNQAASPATRGAFQVRQLSSGTGSLDVHAFVRQAKAGNTGILTGVVDATGVPPVLQGTIGDGVHDRTYEVAGLAANGTTPQGIGDLRFNVANFDLTAAESGYTTAPLPQFTPVTNMAAPFPPPTLGGAFLSAAVTDTGFQAKGDIGATGAHVQHVLFTDTPCSKPDPNRDDYPFFPVQAGTTYTCVRGDFTKDSGVGATPLGLSLDLQRSGHRIALHDAGLTDMPAWLQATFAQAPTLNADTSLRRRCGAVGGAHPDSDASCMPALLRLDTATQATPPTLFGVAQFSGLAKATSEINTLLATPPDVPFLDGGGNPIDLNASPAAGWGNDIGVRLRVGQFPAAGSAADTAVVAGVRLPLPGSLTLDQLQSYGDTAAAQPPAYSASDIRAHFVARTYAAAPHGAIVNSLGNLEAMLASYQADDASLDGMIEGQNLQGAAGGPIPGEVGLDVYARGATQQFNGKPVSKTTYQLDLNLSRSLNIKLHVKSTSGAIGAIDPVISNIPAIAASTPPDYVCNVLASCPPGARVRAELINGPEQGTPPGPPDNSTTIQSTSFHIAQILLNLDFMSARRIDAAIHMDGAANGVELAGFASPDPAVTTPSLIGATGNINFDHFDIDLTKTIDAGFPLGTGHAHLHLVSTLSFGFNAGNGQGTSHFLVTQNVLHVDASSADHDSTVGPINLLIANDNDFSLRIPDFNIGSVDVTYSAGPAPVPPMAETWHECSNHDNTVSSNSITAGSGGFDDAFEPLSDGRVSIDFNFVVSISVKGLVTGKVLDAMCGLSVKVELADKGYPSDPVNYPHHPVPAMGDDQFGTTGPATAALPPASPGGGGGGGGGNPPDTTAPLSQLLTVPGPFGPDGSNGFYQSDPLGVILALDNPAGSGVAGISYRVDGAATLTYHGPFPIGPGTHTVCEHAVDVVGNPEADHCSTLQVDDRAPMLTFGAPALPASGWYTTSPTITISATDANSDGGAGSGVATIVTSFDGGPLATTAGTQSIAVPAGVHNLKAYATDRAGHVAAVQSLDVQVDLSAPVPALRSFPTAPAQNGWFRSLPVVTLRSIDGAQNSGVSAIKYRIGTSGPMLAYTGPITVPSGMKAVQYQAVDVAGNTGPLLSSAFNVDVTAPTAIVGAPSPALFIPLLGPARLNWTVGDDLSGTVRVKVLVYNAVGDVVRQLDAGSVAVTPGGTVSGSTMWDGHDQSLLGIVPVGVYTYRVVVTDQAGNSAQSVDSVPIQLKLL